MKKKWKKNADHELKEEEEDEEEIQLPSRFILKLQSVFCHTPGAYCYCALRAMVAHGSGKRLQCWETTHNITTSWGYTGKPMFVETDRLGNCNNGNIFNHLTKQQSSSHTFKWKEQSPRLHHLISKNCVFGDTQNL